MEDSLFQAAIKSLEDSNFPDDRMYNKAQDFAIEAMYALSDARSDQSRIITFDKTNEKTDAEICGCSILDGKGNVLFDKAIKPTTPINPQYAKEQGIDINTISEAAHFEELFSEINNKIASAEAVIFETHNDYVLLKKSLENLKRPENINKAKLLLADIKDVGISFKKCTNFIFSAFPMYKNNAILSFFKTFHMARVAKKERAKAISSVQKLFDEHLKKVENYRQAKAHQKKEIKNILKTEKREIHKLAKELKHSGLEYREVKREILRPSKEYRNLTRQERQIARYKAYIERNNINPNPEIKNQMKKTRTR